MTVQTTLPIPRKSLGFRPRRLILIGGSARAAAASARAAGMAVAAIDLFGDQDLRAVAEPWVRWNPSEPLVDPLGRLFSAAPDVPTGIVLVGGAESAAESLDDARRRWESDRVRFLMPTASQLRAASDPAVLQTIAQTGGVAFPNWCDVDRTRRSSCAVDETQHWLVKPRMRCGGLAVRDYRGQADTDDKPQPSGYLQRFVSGQLLGVSYCATADSVHCLGVCLGRSGGARAAPYRYAGSIGPLPITADLLAKLHRLGEAIRATLELCGLFGVDLICDGSQIYLLEINARYCASMELLDNGSQNCLTLHCRAFASSDSPLETHADDRPHAVEGVRGKRIVYARRRLVWDPERQRTLGAFLRQPHDAHTANPISAHDLPCLGTVIEAGSPLLTLTGRDDTVRSLWRQLTCQSIRLRGMLEA